MGFRQNLLLAGGMTERLLAPDDVVGRGPTRGQGFEGPSVNLDVILVIAAAFGLGAAMQVSGLAEQVGRLVDPEAGARAATVGIRLSRSRRFGSDDRDRAER